MLSLEQPLPIETRRLNSDRRVGEVNYKRRNYDRRERAFLYHRTVHLSDTNAFGSVYFARFFEFQGEAREEFLLFFLGADFPAFLEQGYNLVTVNAECKYGAPLYLYDDVLVKLQVSKLSRTKLHLKFEIVRLSDQSIAATGSQTIGFLTSEGKISRVPELIANNLKRKNIVL